MNSVPTQIANNEAPPPAAEPKIVVVEQFIHSAKLQTDLLREALQSDKIRIGYLLGAGCPLGIYDADGKGSVKYIPDVAGLTKLVRLKLIDYDTGKPSEETLSELWEKLIKSCVDERIREPNVEHVLTELRTICSRRGKSPVDGMTKDRLKILDEKICDIIAKEVGKSLPAYRCSYNRFASWIRGLQRVIPVEIFTPNYDLLLEEALEQQGVAHFDGFVGTREPFFDLASIEQDEIPARWTRIWKIHGSINWQKREDGSVFRVTGPAAEGKAMIYPSHLKYDQSRRMPYLAMLDRLKMFFKSGASRQELGPPVLVICGYSFSDDHLNEVLLDGLRGNRSAQCFVLAYKSLSEIKDLVKLATKHPNLTVLAWDGAVVGTREGRYMRIEPNSSGYDSWQDTKKVENSTSLDVHSRLGDFHYFGLFLEQLCGGGAI